MRTTSNHRFTQQRQQRWQRIFALAAILSLITGLAPVSFRGLGAPAASAHNLDANAVYVFFDPDTQAMLDRRMAGLDPCFPSYAPPQPLLKGPGKCENNTDYPGDSIGLIIKAVPDNGTTTGVGGYTTFYVPTGAQVTDAAFLIPGDFSADGITGYDRIAAKGQALMPNVGAGGGPTAMLAGQPGISRGPNAAGVTANLVNAANVNNGTLPGVYGDLGIFYSTAPETAYGTYTAASNASKRLTNNSGDVVGFRTPVQAPLNLWDVWQMAGFGIAGTTDAALPTAPRVDANGRGNTIWGAASAVAGPQSGYAWDFRLTDYLAQGCTLSGTPTAACINAATDQMGPWKRIRYPGSQIAYDVPGDVTAGKFAGGLDASTVGWDLSSTPLPATTGQDNGTPNAIRFAYGQLTLNTPEFAWVKFKVANFNSMLDATGCPIWRLDTFGGDAGGDDNGKDHIWRYFDPNSAQLNGCLAVGKPATRDVVKVGDTYQYDLSFFNAGTTTLTQVVVTDQLPAGVTFVSAVPPQTSGPNPLRWVIGALAPGQAWRATVTVKASGTGVLLNTMTATGTPAGSSIPITATAAERTISGLAPYLQQNKSVTPSSIAPGATVAYTIQIDNIGTGATGTPIGITEYLPAGFTYEAVPAPVVRVNGAAVTPAVTATNLNRPVFSIPASLQAGRSLTLTFSAKTAANQAAGNYCNSYTSSSPVNRTTGALACVTVAGGQIGDFIWRDWDGDGVQDAGEEGISGVKVYLDSNNSGVWETGEPYFTTGANGAYYFAGLAAGTYGVRVDPATLPANHVQTGDPDGTKDNMHAVTLITNQQYLTADFGYKPTGTTSIGDKVFEDIGNDGAFTSGTDAGIPNVTVWLYEDSNNDGVIDAGDALVATAVSDSSGDYTFSGLAAGANYLVKVDKSDADIASYFNAKYGANTPSQLSTVEVKPSPALSSADLDNDFGFWRVLPASIGDQLFIDANNNGTYDTGETPLANVTVTLYRAGVPVTTTVSGPDGKYLFANLGPGSYTVVVNTADPDLPAGLSATITETSKTLAAGENFLTADFPFVQVIAKTVDKSYAQPTDALNYTITPYYPGPTLLSNVVIQDAVPSGVTFASAGQGGQLSPYTPIAAVAGAVNTITTGQAIYSDNSNTPQVRAWDGSAFGAQAASVNLQDTPMVLVGAASPTRSEKIVVDIVNNNPEVQAMRWNGTTWAELPVPPAVTGDIGALANLASNVRTLWGGAVAYEQLSGDAVLVWNNTTTAGTNQLTWNVWNGTAWSTNTNISTTGEPQQMRLAANPNSDEMILVTSNASAHDYARVWNGSSWSTAQTLEAASGGAQTAIGVAYEQQSGDGLVVYGKASDVKLYYRTYSGGSWSAEQSLDPAALGVTTQPQWVAIAADPNSDRIAVGVVTNGGKTWLALWDGLAWTDAESATDTALTSTALNVSVAFETMSGELLAAYGTSTAPANIVRYRTWSAGAGWSDEQGGPDIGANTNPNVIVLSPSPNSDRIMLSTNDSENDANYTLWDGDAWGTPTETSTNTGGATNQPVLFLWDRQQAPSSTNNLVASPTTVLNGGSFTVQMTLRAAKRVTGVTPGALTVTNVTGNGATAACGSPSPASQTVPANVPTTFTWTCTGTSAATDAELTFSAGATGTYAGAPGGAYTFTSGASNSIHLLAANSRGAVVWDLGSNTPAVDGVSSDGGAAYCPTTVTLYPMADTYIAKGAPTTWYGATTPLVTQPAAVRYGLFQFDVNSLAGKPIQSAVFGAYVTAARASNHYDRIYRVTTPWTEGGSAVNGATWNDPNGTGTAGAWATIGGAFGASDYDSTVLYSVIGPELAAYYQYGDVTPLVEAWTRSVNPAANNGLVLLSSGADNGDGKYAAREAAGTTTDPVLIVTYLTLTVGGCNSGSPVSTPLTALADTYVDLRNPAVNYGQATTLLTRPADATRYKRGLLWFDLGAIPPGATINSASLSLNVSAARATNHVDEVRVMTTPWYESTASWNDNDAIGPGDWAGGTFGSGDTSATSLGTITPSSTGVKTLDITSAVNNWVNNGVDNHGLALISTGTDAGDAKYTSRESASNRPTLTVNWTLGPNPGPSTRVTLSVQPVLTTPGPLKVTMTAASTSVGSITAVTAPAALGIAGEGDAAATCGSATLKSTDSTISSPSDPVIYEWTCTTTAGSAAGSITFSGRPTGTGGIFATARSNSVLVTPPLTWQGTVSSGAPAVILNTAILDESGSAINNVPSNTTETATSASIGDRVWADANGDGVQDTGELGLAGVKVYVDSNNNGAWDAGEPSDTTDATGAYRIFGLSAGAYTVRTDPVTYPAGYLPTTAPVLTTPSLTTGQQYSAADFGLKPAGTGQIGDTIWLDADKSGSQNGSEAGLPGIGVTLEIKIGGVWYPIRTTTTDAAGQYLFTGLIKGDYRVKVNPTSTVTSPYGGTHTLAAAMAATYDKDGGITTPDGITEVTLPADSTVVTDVDFGYRWAGSIAGRGWYDTNANGAIDGGEAGAPGSSIVLYRVNADGSYTILDVFVTATGSYDYLFANLPPGNYVVGASEQEVPSPTTGAIGTMVFTTPDSYPVTLTAGQPPVTDKNFGFVEAALLTGAVWHDANHTGVLDPGEPRLAGVTVTLTGTDALGNLVSRTMDTAADGSYRFIVPAGTYTITYDAADIPAGLTEPTTPASLSVSAAVGQEIAGLDFGVDNSGKLGNFIWNDVNGDGTWNAGEPGLGSVTVNLYASDGTTLLAAAATDGFGAYQFIGLANATYVVKVDPTTLPAGYTPSGEGDPGAACGGGCDNTITAAVSGGGTNNTVDFGYQPGAGVYPVTGNVWHDNGAGGGAAGDGIKNGSEPGIAGVKVCLHRDANNNDLFDSGEAVVACTTTDANGDYAFPGVPNGEYVVVTDPSTLPNTAYVQTGDPDSVVNHQSAVTVNGAAPAAENFGYREQLGSITGSVCQGNGNGDCNKTGDPSEPGLSGVTVRLTSGGPDGILSTADDVTQTTTTDSSGAYTFGNLLPGPYQIVKSTPAGATSLADSDGSNPNYIYAVLTAGQNLTNQDFEMKPAGAVGDRVWLDEDGDGVQDAGEAGIANVKVTLTNGSQTTTTYTDSNGNYVFAAVPLGVYTVSVDTASLPAGLAANPTYDEDGTGTAHTISVTVTAAGEHMTADFGYNWAPTADVTGSTGTGAIGDRVWIDADGDGVQDANEAGLAGVTVTLYTDPDGNGVYDTPAGTTTTDAAGAYIFDGLAAGAYGVAVTPPTGYTPVGDPDQPGVTCTACDNRTTTPIVLAPGDVYVNADFGYLPDAGTSATIGDRIWLDANANGTQDGGETGIPGVTVALIRDLNGNGIWDAGEPIVAAAITDANGDYSFTGVPVADGLGTDDYLVWVNDTANVLAGLAPAYDRDGIATPNISAVTDLTPAGSLLQDFGYTPAGRLAGDGLIGDTIFLDRDNTGAYTAGEGLEGVTVKLYDSTGATLLAATLTDENGRYYFAGLTDGTYVVKVDTGTLPAGLTNTYDPDSTKDSQSTAVISGSAVDLTRDFGYQGANRVAGTLWVDTNADGVLNGEAGRFAGVTVALYDAVGNIVATTTTDANGNYSFAYLPNGTYRVDVTDRANVLDGYWHSLGAANTDNNSQSDPLTLTLTGSTDITYADFGYYRAPASLGNFVWLDPDGDGIQESGEPGIAGVIVTLTITWPGGATTVVKTTTDSSGAYSFGNLLLDENFNGTTADGSTEPALSLAVATPAGHAPTAQNQGTDDALDADPSPVAAATTQGSADNSYDFGFYQPLTLAGTVWNDTLHRNNLQDADEPGVANVVVDLYADANNDNIPDSSTKVATSTTNAAGAYQFTNLAPGHYIVVIAGSNFNAGSPLNGASAVAGGADPDDNPSNTDSNGIPGVTTKNGVTGVFAPAVTLASQTEPSGDGILGPAPLNRDDNGNGTVDFGFYGGAPLAVDVAFFTVEAAGDGVTLAWETVSETDNAGFNVYRAPGSDDFSRPADSWVKLNAVLIPAAAPGSSEGYAYTWTDATAQPNTAYVYRLEAVELDGTAETLGTVSVLYRPARRIWLPLVR